MRAGKRRSMSSKLLVAAVIAIIAAAVIAPSMALATDTTAGTTVADGTATGRGTGAPDGVTPPEGFDPSTMPQGGRGGAPGGMTSPWLMAAGVALISGAVFFVIGLLVGRKIGVKIGSHAARTLENAPVADYEEVLEAPAIVAVADAEGRDD